MSDIKQDVNKELKGRSLAQDAFKRLTKNPVAMVCFFIIIVYIVLGLFVAMDVGGLYSRARIENYDNRYVKPFQDGYLFGTDTFGRSTFARAVAGTKVSLLLITLTMVMRIPLAVIMGSVAGYYGGVVDDIIFFIMSILMSIPYLLLIMSLVMVLGQSFVVIAFAMAIAGWVGLARQIRGLFFSAKEYEYVLAAKALGASDYRIIFKHIMPNLFHYVIISIVLGMRRIILSEVTLTFLGIGVVGEPSWGIMITESSQELNANQFQNIIAATVFVFIFILAINLFGDALRDALDPKLRNS